MTTPSQSTPFPTFAQEILDLYRPPLRRIATYRKMAHVLEEFTGLCTNARDLTPAKVAQWITAHPDRRASTTRSLLSCLRAAARYGETQGYLTSPFRFRPLAKWVTDNSEPIRRHHSVTAIGKVLALADAEAQAGDWKSRRRRVVIYLAAFTGARALEILGARTTDADLVNATLSIRPNTRRSLKTFSSRREIPIPRPLLNVLREWAGRPDHLSAWLIPHTRLDGPWTTGAPGRKPLDEVRALGSRAGIEGLTLQSLRHSFASAADSWNIGITDLQRWLGHASFQTQRYYRHTDGDALRSAAGRIHFDTPLPCPADHSQSPGG